jgi:hypothetical protein
MFAGRARHGLRLRLPTTASRGHRFASSWTAEPINRRREKVSKPGPEIPSSHNSTIDRPNEQVMLVKEPLSLLPPVKMPGWLDSLPHPRMPASPASCSWFWIGRRGAVWARAATVLRRTRSSRVAQNSVMSSRTVNNVHRSKQKITELIPGRRVV